MEHIRQIYICNSLKFYPLCTIREIYNFFIYKIQYNITIPGSQEGGGGGRIFIVAQQQMKDNPIVMNCYLAPMPLR